MQSQTNETLFEENQTFRQPWLWLLMLVMVAVEIVAFAGDFSRREDRSEMIVPALAAGLLSAGVILLLYTMQLSVRVDSRSLHIRFFPLLKQVIPLQDISKCAVRTYRPLVEYGGWGLRCSFTGKGRAYNVSGKRGVQLEFSNGKRLLIGSQRPEELAAAIEQAKSAHTR